MKTVKNFLVDFVISFLISLPCYFICDIIVEKGIIDWLDIMSGIAGVSILLLCANILLTRHDKEARITKVVNTMTLMAIVATVIYGVFMLLEWLFPDSEDVAFTGNWVQWFPVSISLSAFLHMQDRRRAQSYKNPNDLVVVAGCQENAEAESVCAVLEEKGIKAMAVEKGSPMYIDNADNAPLQIQVMGKDLQSAKKVLG